MFFFPWHFLRKQWQLLEKCPWLRKSARDNYRGKKVSVTSSWHFWQSGTCEIEKVPMTLFGNVFKCPWHSKCCPWHFITRNVRPPPNDTKMDDSGVILAARQSFRLCREACFRYIIEVFCLCVCGLSVFLSAQMKFYLHNKIPLFSFVRTIGNTLYFHMCGQNSINVGIPFIFNPFQDKAKINRVGIELSTLI